MRAKASSQKKKGSNRNSSIWDVNQNVNINGINRNSKQSLPPNNNRKDKKKVRETSKKHSIQCSLEDFYVNEQEVEFNTGEINENCFPLRRCQSLAVSKEESDVLYGHLNNFHESTPGKPRRSQLIPRARLIDRTAGKEKHTYLRNSEEYIYPNKSRLQGRTSSFPININSSSQYQINDITAQERFYSLNQLNSEQFPSHEKLSYHNRPSLNSICHIPSEYTSNKDYGLNLPNYYPNSSNNTDYSCQEDTSVTEREDDFEVVNKISEINTINPLNKTEKLPPNKNLIYDDNIRFKKNSGYENKPRRFRDFVPTFQDGRDCLAERPKSFPNEFLTYVIDIDIPETPKRKTSTEINVYNELDKNIDEINLNCDHFPKGITARENPSGSQEITSDTSHDSPLVENNPIYNDISVLSTTKSPFPSLNLLNSSEIILNKSEQVEQSHEVDRKEKDTNIKPEINQGIKEDSFFKASENKCDFIKTSIKVEANDQNNNNDDEYKTVVAVEDKSHNVVKHLNVQETQKTTKRPLQFLFAKKLTSALSELNIRKDNKQKSKSCLEQNRYHSLPDLSISENLKKSEKIDKKLRKCEKLTIPKNPYSNDRFVVNIGPHFVVNSATPIDFEVKITKVPKNNKEKKHRKSKQTNHQDKDLFLSAVKELNKTLNTPSPTESELRTLEENKQEFEVQNVEKLDAKEIEQTVKAPKRKHQKREPSERKLEKLKNEPLPQIIEVIEIKDNDSLKGINNEVIMRNCSPELIEKVGTIRKHWKKISKDLGNPEDDDEIEETEVKTKLDGEIQTKVEDVIKKFEPQKKECNEQESIVKATKKLFEQKVISTKSEKISPLIKETLAVFEKPCNKRSKFIENSNQFESLSPFSVDIVEAKNEKKAESCSSGRISSCDSVTSDYCRSQEDISIPTTPQKGKQSVEDPEFDRVRFRVMKSELFQKNIYANCENESQLQGLMQYLRDYSFQDLLTDNHIVIIEPIRSTIPYPSTTAKNVTPFLHKSSTLTKSQPSGLRHHFFYHPIRVNKEMNDNELPHPDIVKQVRQKFEMSHQKSHSYEQLNKINQKNSSYCDTDKDNCSIGENSNTSDFGSTDENFENDFCCEYQHVSEDVLKKIRDCGTSVTYYGGKVLDKGPEAFNPMTKAIMDEIQGLRRRECTCRRSSVERGSIPMEINNRYAHSDRILQSKREKENEKNSRTNCTEPSSFSNRAFKLTLLKSNSCSSRLELIGTKIVQKEANLIGQQGKTNSVREEMIEADEPLRILSVKDIINESIRRKDKNMNQNSPKIIAETWKYSNENVDKSEENLSPKINYKEFHEFEMKANSALRKREDIEFEPYEVASIN